LWSLHLTLIDKLPADQVSCMLAPCGSLIFA
jgi:hypothetical protein